MILFHSMFVLDRPTAGTVAATAGISGPFKSWLSRTVYMYVDSWPHVSDLSGTPPGLFVSDPPNCSLSVSMVMLFVHVLLFCDATRLSDVVSIKPAVPLCIHTCKRLSEGFPTCSPVMDAPREGEHLWRGNEITFWIKLFRQFYFNTTVYTRGVAFPLHSVTVSSAWAATASSSSSPIIFKTNIPHKFFKNHDTTGLQYGPVDYDQHVLPTIELPIRAGFGIVFWSNWCLSEACGTFRI